MTEVISVRFRGGCKNYYFDPQGMQVRMGDQVIVETAAGIEFATCTQGNHEVDDAAIVKPLSPVVRLATDNDRRTAEQNRKKEREAFDICEKKIAAHGLEMKLVNVSASFDGSKIIFFFTADGRVDFRELVRDLASVFRARIELRQIGVRDEAKMVGGIGIAPFVGYAERHPTPGVLSMVFGHRLPEDCYPVESLGERIDVESFHENTSEDLEWFLNHVRSRIEAYAERNGLVLACGPAPFLKAVQGFALAAKARCQLSLESRMACGVGACLGCVTKTTEKWPVEEKAGTPVQTCTHGPVFWADQITLEA